MRFLCTIIVLLCLLASYRDFVSDWEIWYPIAFVLFVDFYDIAALQWPIALLYGFLIGCYLVSWGQKLL